MCMRQMVNLPLTGTLQAHRLFARQGCMASLLDTLTQVNGRTHVITLKAQAGGIGLAQIRATYIGLTATIRMMM